MCQLEETVEVVSARTIATTDRRCADAFGVGRDSRGGQIGLT